LVRTQKDFEKVRALELEKYASWASEQTDKTPWFVRNQEFMQRLNFDDYLAAFRGVLADGMTSWSIGPEDRAELPTLAHSPTVILTEGSTDREFLEAGLRVLFPHLLGYYSFMDFAVARPAGGAGALASVVKAFAAAGISNRIVAMFDNDTAAHDACRGLRSIALPPNILVRHYPELEFLRNYPTLGPSGQAIMDVNGLAGSIEMYLGQDVLTLGGVTELQSVQWKGFNEALARYQGEIMHKERVHAAFRQKVERALRGEKCSGTTDWTGLHGILTSILHAFED
jgi:hypothetical protein